jgi:hypothetical protein
LLIILWYQVAAQVARANSTMAVAVAVAVAVLDHSLAF